MVVAKDKKIADETEKVVTEEAAKVNITKMEAKEIADDAEADLKAA